MTAPESTADLARQLVRVDAMIARAVQRGNEAEAHQLALLRDEIRDQRSRLLRLQWRNNTLPVLRS